MGGEAISAAWPSVKANSAVALSVWILSRHRGEGRREISSMSSENRLENEKETHRQDLRKKCNTPPNFVSAFCTSIHKIEQLLEFKINYLFHKIVGIYFYNFNKITHCNKNICFSINSLTQVFHSQDKFCFLCFFLFLLHPLNMCIRV